MTIKKIQEKIDKAKAKVQKFYPGAYCELSEEGYTIFSKDDEDILSEYFLPYTLSAAEAWQSALLTVKTTQHFNRTHPERLVLELTEEKESRLKNKRIKE